MILDQKAVTNIVIEWLDKYKYSKDHWDLVAKEMKAKAKDDESKAVLYLAQALENFHNLYKKKVMKEDNLLYNLVSICFDMVDWKKVAKSRF